LPFCRNCGAEIEPGDLYCGSCGAKIVASPKKPTVPFDSSSVAKGLKGLASRAREQTKILKSEIEDRLQQKDLPSEVTPQPIGVGSKTSKGAFIDSDEVSIFSQVLAWVMKTHVEALKALTAEIVPHMISHNCLEDNRLRLDWATECPATVKNLLMSLPHVEIGLKNVADFAAVKGDSKITVEDMRRLKEKIEETMGQYLSTKDALNALYKASNPISNVLTDIGDIARKNDLTDIKKLRKYEKAANDFMKNVRKTDWSKFTQLDPSPWIEESRPHTLNVINMEVKTSYHHVLYQYPYVSPLAFSTDIERYLVPYFLFIETIDETYMKCRDLFEKCKKGGGSLRGVNKGLRGEATEALSTFNTQYHGIYSARSYSFRAEQRLQKNGDIIREGKRALKKVEQSLGRSSSGGIVRNGQEIIKDVYKFVLLLNEVEPVLKSRAENPW
jgi:hypothetical protein